MAVDILLGSGTKRQLGDEVEALQARTPAKSLTEALGGKRLEASAQALIPGTRTSGKRSGMSRFIAK